MAFFARTHTEQRDTALLAGILVLAVALASCAGAGPEGTGVGEDEAVTGSAGRTEDGLAQAYGVFRNAFTQASQDQAFIIGFGFHPGLSTQKILAGGDPVNGQATINFARGTVTATLSGPSDGAPSFDLYFVKNNLATGTVKPENVDTIFKVGTFVPAFLGGGLPAQYNLSEKIGTAPFPQRGVNFDLDLVVVTLKGQLPQDNVIAVGARTLFEKRFFRERAGATLDPVTGKRADFVETNDPLVQRGAQIFVNEGFNGNGRKCGTCHPLANNQTMDAKFVASLPKNDPLFVFPAGLDDPVLLQHALVRENVDGFEEPGTKFVERGVPHTLSMSTSLGEVGTALGQSNLVDTAAGNFIDGPPPDQRTGRSGDGAPGRGTLNEFAFGAIVQHFPLSLKRVPGIDFRIPTQGELDALEAFQRFNGRQKNVNTPQLTFGDPAADAGKRSATQEGACFLCHGDIVGESTVNFNFDTGIERLRIPFRTPSNMPKDGGFGNNQVDGSPGTIAAGFGNGRFNVPPLFEMADTAPFFHNGAITGIEDAVAFYQTPEFLSSPAFQANFAIPALTPQSIKNIGAFLRTINALENIAQVRKRAAYLETNATKGGTTIMNLMIKDTQDAITVLQSSNLAGNATKSAVDALVAVKQLLEASLPVANNKPRKPMIQAQASLEIAKGELLTGNPNKDF